jgi:multidrug efflux pump subunit AcrA (membrane-fusion protein)
MPHSQITIAAKTVALVQYHRGNQMKFSKKLLFFVPLAAGFLLIFTMVANRKGPSRPEITERSRPVSVITTKPMTIIPRITGYGYVQPTETWEALPEVSGKIIEMHPELKRGAFIAKGALLVRIDPQSYGLAESRGVASVMSVDAQLRELNQQQANTEKLLEIERQKLQLTSQELQRKKGLFAKGFISASELEQEEKNLLAQQTGVDNLINTLKLIPSQEKALLARKDSDVSSLSERRLDIEKTVIRAPFDCRIAEVNIELNQYAPAGTMLLKAVNISAVEIPVQLSPTEFADLLAPALGNQSPIETTQLDMNAIRKLIGISATVRVPLFNREAEWDATFMRTSESIDPETGAITVYVAVDQPYAKIVPSERPPLVPNFYAEVELHGSPRENRYVVPFQTIHNGSVYILDAENRLRIRKVVVEMVMGDFAVVSEGLGDNTTVVTTDLVPAIDGMLLAPSINEELTAEIHALDISK